MKSFVKYSRKQKNSLIFLPSSSRCAFPHFMIKAGTTELCFESKISALRYLSSKLLWLEGGFAEKFERDRNNRIPKGAKKAPYIVIFPEGGMLKVSSGWIREAGMDKIK